MPRKPKKLVSYLGKTIKHFKTDVHEILDEFKVPEYQLLEVRFPFEYPTIEISENISRVGKYLGKGKVRNPYIYITKTKNQLFRLATEEEKSLFDIKK